MSRRRAVLTIVSLATFILLGGCAAPPPQLPQQAYVWQRVWTDAVKQSVNDRGIPWQGLRVLAWQIDDRGAVAAGVDVASLVQRGLPVRAVLRIEGHRPRLDAATVAEHARHTLAGWHAAGVKVDGIEIDHDCASAALGDYARWLGDLRARLPAETPLSITALPTWLESPDLPALREASDESVLQVHAIDAASGQLFDARRAEEWARRWAEASPQPYWVALPAYSLRVAQDADGALTAVDAEGRLDHSGTQGREWRADPVEVAELTVALQDNRAGGLQGLLWFRLPVEGDRRSWRKTTLQAVIAGQPLAAALVVATQSTDGTLHDLQLHNAGNLDAALPTTIVLPAGCRSGDGLTGYRWDAVNHHLLHTTPEPQRPWIAAGDQRAIGWVRCAAPLPARIPATPH